MALWLWVATGALLAGSIVIACAAWAMSAIVDVEIGGDED